MTTEWFDAARNGETETIIRLIEAGTDVDEPEKNGLTALMYAAWKGHDKVIELLIDAEALVDEVSEAGWTALMYAARDGRDKAVELLIAAGADVDVESEPGWTAISLAQRHHHGSTVQILKAPKRSLGTSVITPRAIGGKHCGRCGETKSLDKFAIDRSNRTDGHQGHCLKCRTAYNRRRR